MGRVYFQYSKSHYEGLLEAGDGTGCSLRRCVGAVDVLLLRRVCMSGRCVLCRSRFP